MERNFSNVDEVKDFLIKWSENKKLYIFGAGAYGKVIGSFLNICAIHWEGYIDNNLELQGNKIENKYVFDLKKVLEKREEVVIIISVIPILNGLIRNEVYNQLIENGIDSKNIFLITDYMPICSDMLYMAKKPEEEMRQLTSIKDRYKGKRAFLLGNGPSLLVDDLEKIKNEYSFGCNGIIQLFNKTKWRPTGFYFGDPIFARNNLKNKDDVIKLLSECPMVFTTINTWLFDWKDNRPENLFFSFVRYDEKEIWVERNIEKGICNGGTSLFQLLQIVLYMGFSEIVLLGVDFSFNKEIRNGNLIVNSEVKNHPEGMAQVFEGRYDVDKILAGWICAKKYAETHNIKIVNATRGGKLELFKRCRLDEIIEE